MKTIILIVALVAMATALPMSTPEASEDVAAPVSPVEVKEEEPIVQEEIVETTTELDDDEEIFDNTTADEVEATETATDVQEEVDETTTTVENEVSTEADEAEQTPNTTTPAPKSSKKWYSVISESYLVKKTSEKLSQVKNFLSWIE